MRIIMSPPERTAQAVPGSSFGMAPSTDSVSGAGSGCCRGNGSTGIGVVGGACGIGAAGMGVVTGSVVVVGCVMRARVPRTGPGYTTLG
jgi:hypothetical protein